MNDDRNTATVICPTKDNKTHIRCDLLEPLVRLLVEVDLARGAEVLGCLEEVAQQPGKYSIVAVRKVSSAIPIWKVGSMRK